MLKKGLTIVTDTPDIKTVVTNGGAALAKMETGLYEARTTSLVLEDVIKSGLAAKMLDGHSAVMLMAAVGEIHGLIAQVELKLYPVHQKLTKIAKDAGTPPEGGYAIIKPLDGGR